MLIKTRGIIIKSLKYGESSLILDIYTEQFGLRSYIIGGVRNKKRGNKAGMLQLMSIVNIVAYNKSADSLSRIKEVKTETVFQSLPFDVIKSSVGLFMTEVTRRSITQGEQSQSLFELLYSSYVYLDKCSHSLTLFPILFLLKLSRELGFAPADNFSETRPVFDLQEGQFIPSAQHSTYSFDQQVSQYLYSLLFEDYGISDQFTIPKETRLQLLNGLIKFFRFHVDNFGVLKSLDVLKQIFTE